ncbi:hypothetical protein [Salinirubrum litoreum]|uniref:Uncharacterized protein n=1 Tax=Salinirubrum litoreum TaxID=1126234 RepID=A0ABD5R8D3_9EURY|nr:hypothetical protein [Salinirubrum litoreum]
MNHDRIHAREPTHDADEWETGTIRAVDLRDGHVVFTVTPASDEDGVETDQQPIELVVTTAIRDLVLRRLPGDTESPVGQRVWYKRRGR